MFEERVTVGINTYERPGYVGIALASVLSQTFTSWDLILADNSIKPATEHEHLARLIELIRDRGHEVKLLGRCAGGIPQTYQAMMEASDTELNLRLEDDMWLEPTALGRLQRAILSDQRIAAAAPLTPNASHYQTIPPPQIMRNGFVRRVGIPTYPDGEALEAVDQQQTFFESERLYDVCVIHAGSLYRKSYAQRVGGFSTELSPIGHREETLFYSKLHFAGYRLVVVPGARMWHFEAGYGGSRPHGVDSEFRRQCQTADESIFQRALRDLMHSNPKVAIDVFDDFELHS